MATVALSHDYAAPARAVWDLATDYAFLHRVSRPFVTFGGVPKTGHVAQGDRWQARVRLFGVLPEQDYEMHVTECDPVRMTFLSREKGAGAGRWDHRLTVSPTPGGSRLAERIEIEAGPATPLLAAWARFLYGRRHPARLRTLAAAGETA